MKARRKKKKFPWKAKMQIEREGDVRMTEGMEITQYSRYSKHCG